MGSSTQATTAAATWHGLTHLLRQHARVVSAHHAFLDVANVHQGIVVVVVAVQQGRVSRDDTSFS
jgi:hypothetical protein